MPLPSTAGTQQSISAPEQSRQEKSEAGSSDEEQVIPPELNGIVRKGDRRLAIIDGLVFGEGESKEGIRVSRISTNSVVCYKNNKRFTLHWR